MPALDYLRGLAALAVLLFHYEKWVAGGWNPATFLGKSGVYAVSIFFTLSGLTLTLVYQKSLTDNGLRGWAGFWLKRVFRIFPLLWLATVVTLVLDGPIWMLRQIALNFSGLFGLLDPAGDIALGAWSIGNELVFYAAFPLLISVEGKGRGMLRAIAAVVFAAGIWFAFGLLLPDVPLKEQWFWYVHPANNGFFFVAGMLLGLLQEKIKRLPRSMWVSLLMACILAYVIYPVGGEPAELVTGWNRVALSALAIGMVAACLGSRLHFGGWLGAALQWLGEVSYSVYLLHPLVFRVLKATNLRFFQVQEWWLIPLGLACTLVLSHLTYRLLEKPAMRLGARLAKNQRLMP